MKINIEKERVRNGLTREELTQKLGISSKTYYNWLNGKTDIPSSKLMEMADLFKTTMEYLTRSISEELETKRTTTEIMKIMKHLTKKQAYELADLTGRLEKAVEGHPVTNYPVGKEIEFLTSLLQEEIRGDIPKEMAEVIRVLSEERVNVCELQYEYHRALAPMLRYDLFEPDT